MKKKFPQNSLKFIKKMNKTTVIVPREIKYISDWGNFTDYLTLPCILDKKVTGCGFTEWCLSNTQNIILCSPRKILLENKESQHPNEVFYFRNEYENELRVDKNLMRIEKPKEYRGIREEFKSKEQLAREARLRFELAQASTSRLLQLRNDVKNYYELCRVNNKPCKYLVTYDSFRHIKEVLEGLGVIDNFLVIIDEFQSIFTDSRFKPNTEIELLYHLQSISNLMYVSATPMMEKYLDQLDEFKDLPYYELDWVKENSLRLIHPIINTHRLYRYSIQATVTDIINSYRSGNFDKATFKDEVGNLVEVKSKEAVFYVNSVKNICDIITKAKLTPDECNILCANTEENCERIRKAFKLRKNRNLEIGVVPKRGERHKMFTFCTRTVYLGADFYSTNAKTYIFSDANIDCLAVDITLDLPQIMGRQRLSENPWKNVADLYFKTSNKECTEEECNKIINRKLKSTSASLSLYERGNEVERTEYILLLKLGVDVLNYKNNYVSVNSHAGAKPIPVQNNLVLLSERRAFEIQQTDYKDRFSLFNAVSINNVVSGVTAKVTEVLKQFDSYTQFTDKMRVLATSNLSDEELEFILSQIPPEYSNYFNILGKERISACGCRRSRLEEEINNNSIISTIDLVKDVVSNFTVGERYTRVFIKDKLQEIYNKHNLNKIAKAIDLDRYFDIKPCQIKCSDGRKESAFLILKIK